MNLSASQAHPLRAILAGEWYAPARQPGPAAIHLAGGRISTIESGASQPPGAGVLDARDGLVVPGLVDLQVNGALGASFQASDRDRFVEVIDYHLRQGTTSLLPTLVTAPAEILLDSLAALSAFIKQPMPAGLPGIHLEGPFLSPEKRGAHDPAALRLPDLPLMERFLAASADCIKMVTLAPELPGALELVSRLSAAGLVVSAGHTAASFRQLQAAVSAGLSFATHLGNASDWPHREQNDHGFMGSEPGLVGSFMALPELSGSVIMDGFHFHPALLKPLVQLKGQSKVLLVSDASTVTGLPPGVHAGGGLVAEVHPAGFATSGRGGGWLAGSIITLLQAVQRAVGLAGLPLEQALHMASLGPAELLGLSGRKGSLHPGADADLLILNPDLSLRHVIAGGVQIN